MFSDTVRLTRGRPVFDEWDSPRAHAQREFTRLREAELDREAMCHLLRHRGFEGAALVVAASELTSDRVDDWDGGQYEVTLAVSIETYDIARTEPVFEQLKEAAEAIITIQHFRGLAITLRRGEAPVGWDSEILFEILAMERSRWQPKTEPLALTPEVSTLL